MYLDAVKFKTKDLKVLENTFNLRSNSTCTQEVWSLNQLICVCSRENNIVSYTHIQTISFSYKILYVSLLIIDYLIGLALWDFPIVL